MVGRLIQCLACLILFLVSSPLRAPAQGVPTGRLAGVVRDAQKQVVPGAEVRARNVATGAVFEAVTNNLGTWVIPSLRNGTYDVTAVLRGFRTTVVEGVKLDAGGAATVPITLQIGGIEETVVVRAAATGLQAETATLTSTVTVRQHSELPLVSRDALQLILTQPGIQTPGVPRTSSFNGLPKAALNISIDGANAQDNYMKSSDGFFALLQPRLDSVEEATVSTAAVGSENASGGAVHIKFATRSGSNDFHGGAFWEHRNDALNANYYFNNMDGLPRERMRLNQFGGNAGGPTTLPGVFDGRDRAFFFVNYEEFRLPQSYSVTRTVLTDAARQGDYVYKDSKGSVRTVNLFSLAATGGFPSTPDPMVSRGLELIGGAAGQGILLDRIATANDYTRLNLRFQDPAENIRRFATARFDFRLSQKHDLEFVHHYQRYASVPDSINGFFSMYPGLGTHVGSPEVTTGSQNRRTFSFVLAERWTITPRLVNEVRATSSGNGTLVFLPEFCPASYALFNGYFVNNPYTSAFFAYSSTERRNTPVKSIEENLHWLKGAHSLHFGLGFTQVRSFFQAFDTGAVPGFYPGFATGDPASTGSRNLFTAANFPNSTTGQRSAAAQLYALLTGRLNYTDRRGVLDEESRQYAYVPYTQRNHMREFGAFVQDSWKLRPHLTLNTGLRWQLSFPPVNDNGVYTRPGADGLWGVSGPGNLFKPGVFEGQITQLRLLEKGERAADVHYRDFAPSFGFAWAPKARFGRLRALLGADGQAVLRGGYSIAYVREGFDPIMSVHGRNQGPTYATGANPSRNPEVYGAPGSRLLRDGAYPFLPLPAASFPIIPSPGTEINEFRRDLKPGYVQSWIFGFQRDLGRMLTLEVRYVGNHATRMWRRYGLGEVNIFENGFLDEFRAAAENLRIARTGVASSNNFGNQGLPGQKDIPIIQTALGFTSDTNTATTLTRGEAGRLAYQIANDVTRMNRLIGANLVPAITLADPTDPSKALTYSNFFVVNPQAPATTSIMENGWDSNYHSLQFEAARRMQGGIQFQAGYVFAKSLTDLFNNGMAAGATTLRNRGLDKGVAARDIRHAAGVSWIHELPVGPQRRYLADGSQVLRKILEGWQWSGTFHVQSGTPLRLTSDRRTFNYSDAGVVLHNITRTELQKLVRIRKETVCSSGSCQGVVYWLPQNIIDNTLAAFEQGGKTLADLRPDQPYIGPPTTPGALGHRVFLYGPWTSRWNLSVMKRTKIGEAASFEFRLDLLNAFNQSGLTIQSPSADVSSSGVGATFGQTRQAYRDFTVGGTHDPGGRIIEFQLRIRF